MTVLKLTIYPHLETPDVFCKQQIFFVDEEEQVVAFVDLSTRDHFRLCFKDADFVVKERGVEATRPHEGRVVIEEELLC